MASWLNKSPSRGNSLSRSKLSGKSGSGDTGFAAKQPPESRSFGAAEGTTLGVLGSVFFTCSKTDWVVVSVKPRDLIVSSCKFSVDAQKIESINCSRSTAAAYFIVSESMASFSSVFESILLEHRKALFLVLWRVSSTRSIRYGFSLRPSQEV
ncbi:hypothetical protein AMTR_s00052p00204770 [Amborella trichopoda]|uniref:Uncharacterized protein n=1 Tax=Amborella trichopoda TaxID=13333 RepID=U5CT73_AMBTC|nr:hypothetical protein AMTR_s00052p00204770 [Amborella trichopoda]